jgi:hypothetical protein
MALYRIFIDTAGDRSQGGLLTPVGADGGRRMTSTMVQMCSVGLFLSPGLRDALSQWWLLWLGKHSFAVYLVHGTILRTVGMWIAYGISPDEPAHEDGSSDEERWLRPRSTSHIWLAVMVFTLLTYLAAWAWMRWVDSACASATVWLEKTLFDDEDEEGGGRDGRAENGMALLHGHGNGHANLLENGYKDKMPSELVDRGHVLPP